MLPCQSHKRLGSMLITNYTAVMGLASPLALSCSLLLRGWLFLRNSQGPRASPLLLARADTPGMATRWTGIRSSRIPPTGGAPTWGGFEGHPRIGRPGVGRRGGDHLPLSRYETSDTVTARGERVLSRCRVGVRLRQRGGRHRAPIYPSYTHVCAWPRVMSVGVQRASFFVTGHRKQASDSERRTGGQKMESGSLTGGWDLGAEAAWKIPLFLPSCFVFLHPPSPSGKDHETRGHGP